VGERFYQTNLDSGVLYLQDGRVAVWNGLTSMEETSVGEIKSFYLDGVKYLDTFLPGDFSGKLKAYTYPEEFDEVNGLAIVAPGLSLYDQPAKSFNLSYKTYVGDDLVGTDYGYKIHILYNVIANPDTYAFDTLKEQVAPTEFGWSLVGTPPKIKGWRPTSHLTIDSMNTDPSILQTIEDILYGTPTSNPRLPPITEIGAIFGSLGALLIIDNGDGTWTAVDNANNYITMLDDTTFQIDNADATYLDVSTYEISSTNID
jgi:hypothetical protein